MILDRLGRVPIVTGGSPEAGTEDNTFDLETVRPGPGEPILLFGNGFGGAVTIYHAGAPTETPSQVVATIPSNGETRLPSGCQRYIQAVIAAGTVPDGAELNVTLEGNQTNR